MRYFLILLTLFCFGCSKVSNDGFDNLIVTNKYLNSGSLESVGKYTYKLRFQHKETRGMYSVEYVNFYSSEEFNVGDSLKLVKQ